METPLGKADLHIHTVYSDGTMSVAAALEQIARATDLRLIAITDHDTIAGALVARSLARSFGLEVVVGEEVSTAEGHMLALFIDRWLPPGRPAAETIAAVHAQGGLCIPAHPFDRLVPSMGRAGLAWRCTGARSGEWPVDGVEIFNASTLIASYNIPARRFAESRGLACCGGSDAHSLATLGLGYTLFPGATSDDLYRAIVHGQTQAGGTRWRARNFVEIAAYRLHERLQRGHGRLVPVPDDEPPLGAEPAFGIES